MPMGLLLAAVNLSDEYRVLVIDQSVEPQWPDILEAALKDRPICLGVTAMTGRQIREGLHVARKAKDHGCTVVWGGLHASLTPEQTVSHPLVDFVVQGEGETAFADLVRALEQEDAGKDIPGVWRKVGGQARFGGERPPVDLQSLPSIPYHLVDLKRYIAPGPHGRALTLYTSRGCPQRCTFCVNQRLHRSRWRAFSPERVLEDVRRTRATCPETEHFQFWDDNFFVSLQRAQCIAEGMASLKPRVTWSVLGGHVRDIVRMPDACLQTLRDSGLTDMVVGGESGSQRVLDLMSKNFTVEELLTANRRLGEYRIRPTYSFISGLPGETEDDLRQTLNVMFRLKQDNPDACLGNIKPVLCYPGTALFDEAVRVGFQPPERLDDWADFVWGRYSELRIPWLTPGEKRRRQHIYYYTMLMSPEYVMIDSRVFGWGARLLAPLAKWRLRRFCFAFPVEAWGLYALQRFFV